MTAQSVAVIEQAPRLPTIQAGGAVRAIVPQDFDSAWRIANAVCQADMAPRGLETPAKAMVAIMHGLEVGLTPMNALQSIAVVNGRPTIWGDGAIGLTRGSGLLEWMKEKFEGTEYNDTYKATCTLKRKSEPEPTSYSFSVADAKKANLWGKQGPWQQYPKRMLQMRARAFALRDGFADVLKGLSIREEVDDYDVRDITPRDEPPAPPPATVAEVQPPAVEAPATVPEHPKDEPAAAARAPDMPDADKDPEKFLKWLDEKLAAHTDYAAMEAFWNENIAPRLNGMFPPDQDEANGIWRKHERRLEP